MSMSTHAIGIRPPDAKWQKMKAIYDACVAASVPIPLRVTEFFNDGPPDPAGVCVEVLFSEWGDESSKGVEVQVADIPKDVSIIRFYNSW